VVGAATAFWLSSKRRKTLSQLSSNLLSTGLFYLIAVLIYTFVFKNISHSAIAISDTKMRDSLSSTLQTILTTYARGLVVVCVIYVLVGLTGLILLRRYKPMEQAAEPPTDQPPEQTVDKTVRSGPTPETTNVEEKKT
jgi:predicted PurR-regulated permease PerM